MSDLKAGKVLPFEILEQIFDQVSYTDRFICQSVCKTWSKAAIACVNKSFEIYGPSSIHLLASSLATKTSAKNDLLSYSGAAVKKMKILDNRSMWRNNNNTERDGDKFIQLLQACPNLEEIVFATTLVSDYLEWMDENTSAVKLGCLKCIDMIGDYRNLSLESIRRYMSLTTKYGSKMERVNAYFIEENVPRRIFLNGGTSAAVLLVENNTTIRKHLIHFSPSLTHVFATFKVPISIRSILDVCPGLVQLELVDEDYFYYDDMTMRSQSPKWTKIYGSGGKQQNDASTIYYNLKTLKLGGGVKMFSQDLRYFIFSHQFPSLSTLEITEEAVQLTFRTMNAKSSSLGNDDNIYVKVSISSSPWIEPILKRSTFGKDLATWFPDNRLKFLDLGICSFKGFKSPSKERIFLALEKLNLETLSIDITPILEKYLSDTRLMAPKNGNHKLLWNQVLSMQYMVIKLA